MSGAFIVIAKNTLEPISIAEASEIVGKIWLQSTAPRNPRTAPIENEGVKVPPYAPFLASARPRMT